MSRPIKIKINVSRVLKEHIYPGKNGKYLSLVAFENKGGADQYGNTHFVCQELNEEARKAGEKGPIIGNLTVPDLPRPQPPARTEAARRAESHEESQAGFEEDEIPF